MSSNILALDTSTDACSVALGIGDQVLCEHVELPRKHGELLLAMVNDLLQQAGISLQSLDAIAFGRGPGSFTGPRISAGVVQGLAFGADLPVVPVSSLATVAHRCWREYGWRHCHVAFDARMGEIYWGSFQWNEEQGLVLVGEEQLTAPTQLSLIPELASADWAGAGSGWLYRQQLESQVGLLTECHMEMLPHGKDVLSLGKALWESGHSIDAFNVRPVYLRNEVAAKPKPVSP